MPPLNGYRIVWTFVMFDLPTVTAEERKRATEFRKLLLDCAFMRIQWSIYARPSPSEERAAVIEKSIMAGLPPGGNVRMFQMTDKQYSRIKVFYGKSEGEIEKPPEQLTLF